MKSIAAIVAGLICFAGCPAWADAQVAGAGAATSVKNIYDPILNNYQELVSTTCAAKTCIMDAPPVTKTTLVQHISCGFSLPDTALVNIAGVVVDSGQLHPFNLLNVFAYGSTGSNSNRAINADTFILFKRGEIPGIEIEADAVPNGLACTLSGYHQ